MNSFAFLFAVQLAGFGIGMRRGVAPSRRLLAATLGLMVPLVGLALALVVRRTVGVGSNKGSDPREQAARRMSGAEVRRQAELPPLLERLISTDPSERLAALVGMNNIDDGSTISLLRWTVDHGCPEVVLDAALTLEALDLRREERIETTRLKLAEDPTYERAMAAAEAAASGIFTGIADAASVIALADQARASYDHAIELAPERLPEIAERLVRLELAAVRPEAALEFLTQYASQLDGEAGRRLRPLRDDAAFAARRFELLLQPLGG